MSYLSIYLSMCVYIYIHMLYIYIYIYICRPCASCSASRTSSTCAAPAARRRPRRGRNAPVGAILPYLREMGGAPRNPAPRNHFLAWIVKSPGCHCTDAFDAQQTPPLLGWHYLSNATCLIRPHVFYALFIVSRIIIICYIIRHCRRTHALDK